MVGATMLVYVTVARFGAIPGHLAGEDYEYVREGSVSGFSHDRSLENPTSWKKPG